ncbi:MAG: hypothetical protein K6G46_00925 [Prevotella sp.]|jgi:hypothetical protein|nr:hypothetical protein [Prevotella sp.]
MKKIFLLFAAVGVLIACDPVHEKINNGNHISVEELIKQSKVIVDKVNKIADQKTYTAAKDAPITLIENIDVTDCDGVTVYFDAETVADAYWTVSVAGGEPQKILRNAGFFRYKVPEGTTNVSDIVLKHTENTESNTITVKAIYKTFGYHVSNAKEGEFGNVITCETSAPVNAKWDIGGKEFLGNFATKKMKVAWDENGNYVPTDYVVTLTALCPDGTKLVAEYPVECDKISDPLVKYYIYGDPNRTDDEKAEDPQLPFKPGAWDAAAMRFSSTEGAHLPTIPDEVYFGLKTLIFDVAEVTPDFDLKVMNGWWSNTYYDHVKWVDGLNELPITQTMADECAKGGEGRDLDLMLYNGTMLLKTVYYEE